MHSLTAYEFFTTAREPIAEITDSKSARTPTTTRRGTGQIGLCSCPLPRNCCREEGPDLSDWPGFRLFPLSKIKNAPLLAWPARLHTSYFTPMGRVIIILPLVYLKSREKPEK